MINSLIFNKASHLKRFFEFTPIEKKFRNVTAPKFFKVCISTPLHVKLGYNCKHYSSKAEKNVFLKSGGF